MAFSDLLNKPFSELTKAQFLSFLQNQFLKGFFTPVFNKDNVVSNYVSNLQFIKQVNILGSADDLEDLIVLEIIKQNKGDSRVGLTSEIFKLISNNDFLNKPRFNVLAIVRSEKEPEQWRLSLVTSEGKTRSNPRRFSFILGVNEKVRTPKQQLIDLGGVTSWEDLKDRFNVEVVRKEFFKLYINLFLEVYDAIITNDVFDGIIKKKELEPISFAKNLMGKIVFLHFIQKKGWLGITDKNGKFGEGDHKFFKNNLDKLTAKGDLFNKRTNFYNDFLEPLFYDGLNKEHENDWNNELQMKIPYLNGGLFQEEYDRKRTTINLDNDIFKAIIESFDVYNFTIDEGDIYDREIAVDPEMLGKIFESMIGFNIDNQKDVDRVLNEYKGIKKKRKIKMPSPDYIIDLDLGKEKNKKLGAFYTPREIVGYMTRESIIEYLVSKLGEDLRNTIRQLFKYKDEYLTKQEIETKTNEVDNQLNSLETKITYSSLKHDVFDVIELLNDIKVLDPAVGSGAFPMGILQELVSLKEYLINVFGLEKKTTYEIKREIIQNNIFGVDIDPGAVSIARLRFWLGLVVDEEKPEPLPNLDFKFVCANSLIPLAEKNEDEQDEFTKEANLDTLRKYKREYYNESDKDKKQQLAERIRNYRSESNNLFTALSSLRNQQILEFLRNFNNPEHVHSFFDPKLMFSEGNGFDIVIGNPPYIEFKNMDKNIKKGLKIYETTKGKYDLYIPFIERAHHLSCNNGTISYICPTRFLKRDYGTAMRNFIKKNIRIKEIIDFSDFQVFDTALAYTGIFIFQKKKINDYDFDFLNFSNHPDCYKIQFPREYFEIINSEKLNENTWNFSTGEKDLLINKIKENKVSLKSLCDGIYQGIATGKDDVFIVDHSQVAHYNMEKDILYPFLKGKDIGPYTIKNFDRYVIYPYYDDGKVIPENIMKSKYPNVYKYLIDKKSDLGGREYFEKSNKLRFELWNQRKLSKFLGEKIVTLDNASVNSFALDCNNYLGTTTVYNIVLKNKELNKYILGLLNSSLLYYYHKNTTIPQAGGFYRYQALFIKDLPLAISNDELVIKKIIDLVTSIINYNKSGNNDEINNCTKQIDELVYKLYGLTDEEIKIVEDDIK